MATSALPPFRRAGNGQLLARRKTAFLCSRKMFAPQRRTVMAWADSLSPDRDCLLCGNLLPVEQAVLACALRRHVPAILVLAETFPPVWSDEVGEALAAGRLLVVTPCDETVHFVSGRSAADRNHLMLSLADDIVVGRCTPGGNLSRQLASYSNVTILSPGAAAAAGTASTGRRSTLLARLKGWLRALLPIRVRR